MLLGLLVILCRQCITAGYEKREALAV